MTSSRIDQRTTLERLYYERRKQGKVLYPVRLAPSATSPLGKPVPTSTPWNAKGDWWALGRHTGADFTCPTGSRALALTFGRVVWVGERGGWSGTPRPGQPWAYGIHVIIRTGDREFDYAYCHLSVAKVRTGQKVRPGQVIGLTGNTGNSTGPHLHLEARPAGGRYGSDVSPMNVRRRNR